MNPFEVFNNLLATSAFESFTKDEKASASLIFKIVFEEYETLGHVNFRNKNFSDENDDECSFNEKIELTMNNLIKIIHIFEEAAKAKDTFKKRGPVWSPLRLKNIMDLRKIANKINIDRFNCNISKVTSSVVGILGGAAIIASLVFPPAAVALAIGGSITAGVSGATVFGTSMTEISLLRSCMKKAGKVKEEDEKNFELISLWFKHSQDVIDAFEEIIGFSVAKEIYEGLQKFGNEWKEINLSNKNHLARLKNLIKNCICKILLPGSLAGEEFRFLISTVISFFFVVVLFRKHNRLLFDSIIISHRIVFGLLKLLDVSADLGMIIANAVVKTGIVAGADSVTKAAARVVAHGVFAGLGIALDVTNMVFASIDIHKGSISPLAKTLETAADQLEKEHQVLTTVYNSLFP